MEAVLDKMQSLTLQKIRLSKLFLVASYSILFYLTAIDLRYFEKFLRWIFPQYKYVIYTDETPLRLLTNHMIMAFSSSIIALLIAAAASAFIFSRFGKEYKDLILSGADFLQTLPSVAIIGVVVPAVGYGLYPVVIALVAYSILPLVINIVKGFESISPELIEAAEGLGLSSTEIILRVKLPLAMPAIISGIKNVLIINVSAATLGAVVGAGGYGVPIMAGIHDFNSAYIIQGAVPSTLLALIIEEVMSS